MVGQRSCTVRNGCKICPYREGVIDCTMEGVIRGYLINIHVNSGISVLLQLMIFNGLLLSRITTPCLGSEGHR